MDVQLNDLLGEGYFGKVYQGIDRIHGRVAVKVFEKKDDQTIDEWKQKKRDLLAEGQHLKFAEHPNVVRVFYIDEPTGDDKVYLVMELCEGGCLQDEYKNGPMLLSTLRHVLTDAALGLGAVHSRGMLHRDIKPSNILLNGNGRAKIGDFGLVTNEVILGYAGRAGYNDHLAIETHFERRTSVKTDVWAFGMTVYRLLHGQSFYDMLPLPRYEVSQGDYAKRLPWLPHIPQAWRRFVRQCMNDDPNKRPQSAIELLQKLEKLPVTPDWKCVYQPSVVHWNRKTRKREINIVWEVHSAKQHSWVARSLPIVNSGKERYIGGSDGVVSAKNAQKGLEAFFEKQE